MNTALLLFARVPKLSYYEMWSAAGPLLWFAAVRWYERERRLVAGWTGAWRAWVWFFPAAIIFSFFRGLSVAESVRLLPPNVNTTHVFVLGRADPLVGRVLFKLEDYILLRTNKDGEVEAIPRAQVSLIVEGGQR